MPTFDHIKSTRSKKRTLHPSRYRDLPQDFEEVLLDLSQEIFWLMAEHPKYWDWLIQEGLEGRCTSSQLGMSVSRAFNH